MSTYPLPLPLQASFLTFVSYNDCKVWSCKTISVSPAIFQSDMTSTSHVWLQFDWLTLALESAELLTTYDASGTSKATLCIHSSFWQCCRLNLRTAMLLTPLTRTCTARVLSHLRAFCSLKKDLGLITHLVRSVMSGLNVEIALRCRPKQSD